MIAFNYGFYLNHVFFLLLSRYGFLAAGADQTLNARENVDNGKETEIISLLRKRELKWLDMISNWDTYMMRNYKKVRERCRKGIPSSVRPRAWMHLCGAQYHMINPDDRHEFKRLYVSTFLTSIVATILKYPYKLTWHSL